MVVLVRFVPIGKGVVANLGRLESCRTAPTFSSVIPGIKEKVEISKIVTTPGIKNSRNGLDHIKTKGFPLTLGVVRISEIVTTPGIKNST